MVASAATAIGVSGLVGIGAASAQSDASSGDPMSGLVDKLAAKFNLNKEQVQSVFDESRSEMEAQHEARQSERLQDLVDDGTITEAQKDAIKTRVAELKSKHKTGKDSFKDLTGEERRTKMEEERSSLEAWAQEQGLDLSKLRGIFMGGRGFGGPPPERRPSDSN